MRELLELLLRVNLAVAAAVLAVMVLRIPARRLFGPRLAYTLWILPALAVGAALIPAPLVTMPAPPSPDIAAFPLAAGAASPTATLAASSADLSPWLLAIWALGGLAMLLALGRSQSRFNRAVGRGCAGPAVVGVLKPKVIIPADFASAYSPQEQRMILAHEAAHVARHDSRINALMAIVRCVAWFNPLAHLMARLLRVDQELACDAAVMAKHPRSRRTYADALLKTQVGAHILPFGCHWALVGAHPLVTRVSLLARPRADAASRAAGLTFLIVSLLSIATAIWAARPPRIAFAPSHEAEILDRLARNAPARPAPHPAIAAAGQPRAAHGAPATAPIIPQVVQPDPTAPVVSDSAPVIRISALVPPPRQTRVWKTSNLSFVEPGLAVRVVATMTDPEGVPLVTDLTAFGSQALFRYGYIERHQSHDKLFTRVVQHGDRLEVSASLGSAFWPEVTGAVDLASGETGTIRLPGGRIVTVTPIMRPETPDEIAAAHVLGRRPAMSFERFEQAL